MPGSPTAPGQPGAGESAPGHVAFHQQNCVGTRVDADFAAQWLAYALPDRRFARTLADADARLGAGVDRYSFTAVDLHHLLLAGLPAHSASRPEQRRDGAPRDRRRREPARPALRQGQSAYWPAAWMIGRQRATSSARNRLW